MTLNEQLTQRYVKIFQNPEYQPLKLVINIFLLSNSLTVLMIFLKNICKCVPYLKKMTITNPFAIGFATLHPINRFKNKKSKKQAITTLIELLA